MDFQVGQRVVFLFEEGGGVIKEITKEGKFIIEDEFGFDRHYHLSDIGAVHTIEYVVDEKSIPSKDEVLSNKSTTTKMPNEWTIDLHIEELVDNHSNMSNYDILQLQMRKLRAFVMGAQDKKVRKIIVIHGVGEGVLKHEVVSYLRGIPGSETFDGNYWEYGQGATVALLRYKY